MLEITIANFCDSRAFPLLALYKNRPYAASHSCGRKPPRWREKVALGQDQQKAHIILNGNFLRLSCPSETFALQHGGFVSREWLAAKGLLLAICLISHPFPEIM